MLVVVTNSKQQTNGTKGVQNRFFWKSLTTWSRNFGTYANVYPNPLDEFSFLAEGSYNGAKLPFAVKAGVADGYGDRFEQRIGGYLGIEFNF